MFCSISTPTLYVLFIGWATAEYLTTKLIPLWVGARAIEFNWVHTQLSFDANISLVGFLKDDSN